jgi:2-polyprenyl-3-methyl-5-hydroxy-6-metoxy-1,4-benzoquinol methylase
MTDHSNLNQQNIAAWDRLYQISPIGLWGTMPLPFLIDWKATLMSQMAPKSRLLDAGAGQGRNLPVWMDTGIEVHACDASAHALEAIPENLKSAVHLRCCELSDTGYPDHHFSIIVLMDVFETLPCVASVLAELHRILKPGGHLLVNIPDQSDPIAQTDMQPLVNGAHLYAETYYYHFYPKNEAEQLLRKSGFQIFHIQSHTWNEAPHPHYREHDHSHTSTVFLARRNTPDDAAS